MSDRVFTTPKEAEDAFYQAFEKADLDAMMHVWLKADYVECIHPMSNRLLGLDAIRDSWQEIFSNNTGVEFATIETRQLKQSDLAIHVVNESLKIQGKPPAIILATNIYEKTATGWHMILHHASPAPRHITNKPAATLH